MVNVPMRNQSHAQWTDPLKQIPADHMISWMCALDVGDASPLATCGEAFTGDKIADLPLPVLFEENHLAPPEASRVLASPETKGCFEPFDFYRLDKTLVVPDRHWGALTSLTPGPAQNAECLNAAAASASAADAKESPLPTVFTIESVCLRDCSGQLMGHCVSEESAWQNFRYAAAEVGAETGSTMGSMRLSWGDDESFDLAVDPHVWFWALAAAAAQLALLPCCMLGCYHGFWYVYESYCPSEPLYQRVASVSLVYENETAPRTEMTSMHIPAGHSLGQTIVLGSDGEHVFVSKQVQEEMARMGMLPSASYHQQREAVSFDHTFCERVCERCARLFRWR